LALRKTIAKVGATATAIAAATFLTAMGGPAAFAQVTSGISYTPPSPVQTTAQYNGTKYLGDAGEITITIPASSASSVFTPGSDLTMEQCLNNATSQGQCDGLTVATSNVGITAPIVYLSGAVTLTFDVFILPTGNLSTTPDAPSAGSGFDPNSTTPCNSTTACSVWVGQDTTNWSQNSYLINGITLTAAPSQGQIPESPSTSLLPLAGGGAVVGGGLFVALMRRRRAGTH
jgi:hypothetical protein